nr:SMP-30/gluconolactonase/LRE family protein [Caldimonas brevitalea]
MASSASPPCILSDLLAVWPARAGLGEGLSWSPRQQALYWVDIVRQRLYRYTPANGHRERWYFDEPITAVAERRDGPGLLVSLRSGFAYFEPEAHDGYGRLRRLHEPEPERLGNRFNDAKCDPLGRYWASTMDAAAHAATGALYRYDGDGRCTRHLDRLFAVANGPCWSPDGTTLYLSHTSGGEVWAFDFDLERGELSRQRVWLSLAAGDGLPDGLTTDVLGRVWVARWGAACVTCHAPDDARELFRLALPASQVSNVAFGGPTLQTLFITTGRFGLSAEQLQAEPLAGALFAIETDTTGLPPTPYAG